MDQIVSASLSILSRAITWPSSDRSASDFIAAALSSPLTTKALHNCVRDRFHVMVAIGVSDARAHLVELCATDRTFKGAHAGNVLA